jgi:NAD(P)H-nitrite reductase large subunit
VVVDVPDDQVEVAGAKRLSPLLAKPDGSDNRRFVIIGGGAAGNSCAEQLRREGFKGQITILCGETRLPYDRVVLSKNLTGDLSGASLRSQDFYTEYGIDVQLGSPVETIDAVAQTVTVKGGRSVQYDKLCIATGA